MAANVRIVLKPGEFIDRAFRRFKRSCDKAGVPKDFERASHYLKPGERKRLRRRRARRARRMEEEGRQPSE